MAQIQCVRCNKASDPITTAVYGGKLKNEIKEKICQPCWNEWKEMSIKVINEYKLDLNDPKSDELLTQQMRTFLNMPA